MPAPPRPKNIMSNQSIKRVEISGGLASGKTTLAALTETAGLNPILEDFAGNPFLKAFYAAPDKYALETEIAFLLQHFHQIKKLAEADEAAPLVVCDFSLLLDCAFADVTLDASKRRAFDSVFEEVQRELGPPTILIHLDCCVETQLARIRARDRRMERSVSLQYLRDLESALRPRISSISSSVHVLSIDSDDHDFANDDHGRERVLALLRSALAA